MPKEAKSVIASEKVNEYFPDDVGLLALLVFHDEAGWDATNLPQIDKISEWLAEEKELNSIESSVPFH